MIRTFAVAVVFAISLFALPSHSTLDSVPTPSCTPDCPYVR